MEELPMKTPTTVLLAILAALLPLAGAIGRSELAPVARTGEQRGLPHRESAAGMERDEEPRLEGRDRRARHLQPRRLGGQGVPHRREEHRGGRSLAPPTRGSAGEGLRHQAPQHPLRDDHALRGSSDGQDALARDRHDGHPPRGPPQGRQLRLRLALLRRRATLLLVRIGRSLRLRPRRQEALGAGSGEGQGRGQPRRGQLARGARRKARPRPRPRRTIDDRGPRRDRRPDHLEEGAR